MGAGGTGFAFYSHYKIRRPYNGQLLSLSIVIPAYNEERRLPGTLDAVLKYLHSRQWVFVEVIVVDDGSSDRTAQIVRDRAQADPIVRLVQNPGNQGKGYAVRNGMREARGKWILFSDADLSAPIEELEKLIAAARKENAEVAIGSRALDRSLIGVHQPALREWSGRFFNLFMRILTGLPFADTQCGFKLYSAGAARQIFERQRLTGFGFDVEDLFLARKLGCRTVEVPVRWSDVAGTKVGMSAGVSAFVDILRVLWNHFRGRYRYRQDG